MGMISCSTPTSCRNAPPAFFRALQVDLHRAIVSSRFVFTVIFMLLRLFLNGSFDWFMTGALQDFGIPYVFDQAIIGDWGLGMLILPLATLPYASGYLIDRNAGFDRYAIREVGLRTYSISKVVAVATSAFLASVLAGLIFLAMLCATGATHDVPGHGAFLNGGYLDIVILLSPAAYYCARLTLTGMTCAMAATVSLYVSTWIPNLYVILLTPLVMYYTYFALIDSLWYVFGTSRLSTLLNLNLILTHHVDSDLLFSFLWAIVYQFSIVVLCGLGFSHRLRKEYAQ